MARTLASAWVSVSPTGFKEFAAKTKVGLKDALKNADAMIQVTADVKPAVAGIDGLKLRLDELSKKVTDARVGVDDKDALASLARMDVKLDTLGARTARPGVTLEGEKKILADILTIDAALDALGKKTAKPDVSGGGGGLLSRILPGGGVVAVRPVPGARYPARRRGCRWSARSRHPSRSARSPRRSRRCRSSRRPPRAASCSRSAVRWPGSRSWVPANQRR